MQEDVIHGFVSTGSLEVRNCFVRSFDAFVSAVAAGGEGGCRYANRDQQNSSTHEVAERITMTASGGYFEAQGA
jgi:hypothetical protein